MCLTKILHFPVFLEGMRVLMTQYFPRKYKSIYMLGNPGNAFTFLMQALPLLVASFLSSTWNTDLRQEEEKPCKVRKKATN